MTFQTLFLAGVVAAFSSLFLVLMYVWITVNLHQMKQARTVTQVTPAQRPAHDPLKLAA
ncbi:hypothetical protein [Caulobacter sp. NIBR1757]|uniref:hypothetical protein n=1 Tax=Caulobacter sp. NIBR1757 TaxID=3016000 RepID=UPI0022F0CD10|nr:hypothetical protein [Caulobacter sp. NIBR1757]WGM40838.1 hypothetical protein AMEJIAPC_03785 [Caulobacter sp. NIBR1757]